jgi:hypothetical protein
MKPYPKIRIEAVQPLPTWDEMQFSAANCPVLGPSASAVITHRGTAFAFAASEQSHQFDGCAEENENEERDFVVCGASRDVRGRQPGHVAGFQGSDQRDD